MHDHPIPRMGGLAIFFGFIVTIVLMVAFMLMPASNSALIPIMVLMFALALVNVSMKGVQFSVIDEMGVDPKVNGMAIAVATLVGFNLPDVARRHPRQIRGRRRV